MGLKAKNQLILVKTIDFRPLVPQKLSVESSMNDDVYRKKVSNDLISDEWLPGRTFRKKVKEKKIPRS